MKDTETSESISVELTQVACLGDQKYPSFELRKILSYLDNQGHSDWCNELLKELSLTQEDLHSPFISAFQALQALKRVTKTFYTPGLGHQIAMTYSLEDFDELGTCISHAETLGEALFISNTYYDLVGSFNDLINISDEANYTQRLVNISRLDKPLMRFLFELTISGILKLGQALSDHSLPFVVIRFEDQLSEDEKQYYSDIYHTDIEDSASFNEWVISHETLKREISCSHSDSIKSEEDLKRLLRFLKEDSGLVGDIDNILRGSPGDFPDPEMISHALGISSRTLRRRLSKLGTSFSALMDKVRCQLALNLIQNKNLPNEEIAAELGYSDAANFCNAFKKWTGHAPSYYRL